MPAGLPEVAIKPAISLRYTGREKPAFLRRQRKDMLLFEGIAKAWKVGEVQVGNMRAFSRPPAKTCLFPAPADLTSI